MKPLALPIAAVGLVSFILIMMIAVYALVLRHFTKLRQRLSIRIASLILLTGPAVLLALLIFNAAFYGTIGQPAPWWSRLVQFALVVLGTPLLLGLLAARYVTRPLGEFTRAIASIKDNDYRVRLQASGVYEFDRVFGEFNELFERLSEEEGLRKNLISDTSHELNTPIAALIGQLEGMQEGVIKKDKAHLAMLLDEAYRLNDTAARLMEYARMQSHALKLNAEDVPLQKLAEELAREHERQLQESGIVLRFTITAPTIHADKTLLKQLLANLIQNAVRYSSGDELRISYDGNVLTAEDNGRGVPADALAHLFERFYRVESSRSRNTGGLGLGLAIVKEIAASHGWQARAEQGAPGLRFVFALRPGFIQNSHAPALLPSMKTTHTTTKQPSPQPGGWRELGPWIAVALIALGLILFTYTATQQSYRQNANDPQIQMAEDAAAAWNNGAAPASLVGQSKVDAGSSLAPFTIVVDTNGNVLASGAELNGTTPLPPLEVWGDAHQKGELRFTWQVASGQRFAAVVDPTPGGAVLAARSLREVEQREERLVVTAALTLLGVIGVLVLAYIVIAR